MTQEEFVQFAEAQQFTAEDCPILLRGRQRMVAFSLYRYEPGMPRAIEQETGPGDDETWQNEPGPPACDHSSYTKWAVLCGSAMREQLSIPPC